MPQPHREPSTAGQDSGWRAHLALHYGNANGKTVLLQQRHSGPLLVQKPFYPEGPQTCHTYLIHPPGGVVGGDSLGLDLDMRTGGHAVVTTPAAGKFYRSAGGKATQYNRLEVRNGAALEWMPQETIIYDRANAKLHTVVRLAPGAAFIGWEMVCLGLPASGQPWTRGDLDQRLEIWRDDKPLLLERLRIRDRESALLSAWGMAGHPVTGTLVATTGERDLLPEIRSKTDERAASGLFTATRFNGLTVCRYLGDDVYDGFRYFLRAWEIVRPAVTGRAVCAPRIWAT